MSDQPSKPCCGENENKNYEKKSPKGERDSPERRHCRGLVAEFAGQRQHNGEVRRESGIMTSKIEITNSLVTTFYSLGASVARSSYNKNAAKFVRLRSMLSRTKSTIWGYIPHTTLRPSGYNMWQ